MTIVALGVALVAFPATQWRAERAEEARIRRLLAGISTVESDARLPTPGAVASAGPVTDPEAAPQIDFDFRNLLRSSRRAPVVRSTEPPPPSPSFLEPALAGLRAWETAAAQPGKPLPTAELEALEQDLEALLVRPGASPAERRLIMLTLARVFRARGQRENSEATLRAALQVPAAAYGGRAWVGLAELTYPEALLMRLRDEPGQRWPHDTPRRHLDQALRLGFGVPWRRYRARLLQDVLDGVDGTIKELLSELGRSRDEPDLGGGALALRHGEVALFDKQDARAVRMLTEAASFRGTAVDAQRLLAIAHAEAERWPKALSALLAALRYAPDDLATRRLAVRLFRGERLIEVAPKLPLADLRAWVARLEARLKARGGQRLGRSLLGTVLCLQALRGGLARVDLPTLERGIQLLSLSLFKQPIRHQDPSTMLSLAVAHYVRVPLLPPGKRTAARKAAWEGLYDLELKGRAVAKHVEVKALRKRFETDIPEAQGQ